MGDSSVPKRQELEGRQVKVGLPDQVQSGREHREVQSTRGCKRLLKGI